MKKILIVSQAMEIGGAEKALLGILENIDLTKYEVELFLLRHTGELLKDIPSCIKLLPEIPEYASLAKPMKDNIECGEIGVAIGRIYGRIKATIFGTVNRIRHIDAIQDLYSHKYTVRYMPMISDEEYDLAVSFLAPHYFVSKRVKAKKKIGWIHTDYKTLEIDKKSELEMWSTYDYIASISDDVTESFLHSFPSLKEKIILIENIMPCSIIHRQAKEFSVEGEMPDDGSVKLLTIGRFTYPKRMDEIPVICQKIRESGVNAKWYLIGYGEDEDIIRRKIAESRVEDSVIILGKKENPYPYIKATDVYIQPSRFEGKSIAVREAQIFHKPVIITNYSTANSQLEDGVDGVIVPMEENACAAAIAEVLKNKNLLNALSQSTKTRDYVGAEEIKKLYSVVECHE